MEYCCPNTATLQGATSSGIICVVSEVLGCVCAVRGSEGISGWVVFDLNVELIRILIKLFVLVIFFSWYYCLVFFNQFL